jgi:hypothetical protein
MEPPQSGDDRDGTLKTLQTVFGGDGALDADLVREVVEAEGGDMKLCCEVLWQLMPQAGVVGRFLATRIPGTELILDDSWGR